ncbi:CPBP family intramembrane glutamic endopeptidase [Adlercreutzia agrestimuris]|uniref:CPBP family intramembrane glutamic endopeptidase n=1 Tax=Adlercreutzia agrestimuris TaxID=2941324 RepID=UPI0020420842|nr:CPBP family intramembrane glutamic endopeptidase [Adlercreutzia agrestimuris]
MIKDQENSQAFSSPSAHAVILHPFLAFVVAFVLTLFVFQTIPASTPVWSLFQGLLLSAILLVIIKFSDKRALAKPASSGVLGRWVIYVLLVAAISGLVTFYVTNGSLRGLDQGVLIMRTFVVCGVCLVTGIFEEALFRVLVINAFSRIQWPGKVTNPKFKAAILSALLFGFLHVSIAGVTSPYAMVQLQTFIKFIQASLFGFIMAAFYIKTKSLWSIAAMHAVFDILYLGPVMMAYGIPASLVTNEPVNLILLAVTSALLLAPAISAGQMLSETSPDMCEREEICAYE